MLVFLTGLNSAFWHDADSTLTMLMPGFLFFSFPVSIRQMFQSKPQKNSSQLPYSSRNESESFLEITQALFSDYPQLVEIYHAKGTLAWVNQHASKFWNLDFANPLGTFNILQYQDLQNSPVIKAFNKALAGNKSSVKAPDYHGKISGHFRNQGIFETFVSPLPHLSFEIEYIVLIHQLMLKDETKSKKKKEVIDDVSPTRFLSNVSHELRTPLNWILGFSELIDSESDIIKIREYNKNIKMGGRLLLNSIEMLIDISRIIKNENILQISEVSIPKILTETHHVVSNEAVTLKKDLAVYLKKSFNDQESDLHIFTDEAKLRQILMALAHNSLKYTGKGFIEIGCRQLSDNYLLFSVKDTGIGISKDIQKFIFDVFRRGDEKYDTPTGGLGIGLSIAKNYVSTLGGEIWLESESGEGTTFYFTIANQTPELLNTSEKRRRKLFRRIHKSITKY